MPKSLRSFPGCGTFIRVRLASLGAFADLALYAGALRVWTSVLPKFSNCFKRYVLPVFGCLINFEKVPTECGQAPFKRDSIYKFRITEFIVNFRSGFIIYFPHEFG